MKLPLSVLLISLFILPGSADQNALENTSSLLEDEEYVITIESNVPNQKIEFIASYAFGDEDLVVVNEETPYQLISKSPHLNVIIQSESSENELKVFFHENVEEENKKSSLSATGRTIMFGARWSRGPNDKMELGHFVTVR